MVGLNDDDETEQLICVMPRCGICGKHADYWCKHRDNGQSKWYCELCGALQLMKMNGDWHIINLK
ncbi:MAG TPA: hypothetical protein ENN30_00715 [Candidatus Woesearchaeota archaeon]|nr:hypothetical protein [Candidatus Woesearchaeota archaeon]